ncbi:unnamed protein product [Brassica napus]|uniref:(rape) hypothetical protein n=1 Tax=Brassica napus TaxID=3708 RepID=A0A816MMJ4_BRANA|nr:unnamed protein product [Brassica napus]
MHPLPSSSRLICSYKYVKFLPVKFIISFLSILNLDLFLKRDLNSS